MKASLCTLNRVAYIKGVNKKYKTNIIFIFLLLDDHILYYVYNGIYIYILVRHNKSWYLLCYSIINNK